jgi:hypothetical protein
VVEAVTVALGGHGDKIALSEQTRLDLINKFGVKQLEQFAQEVHLYGGNYEALTEPEGKYLLRSPSLNSARDNILARRQQEIQRRKSEVAGSSRGQALNGLNDTEETGTNTDNELPKVLFQLTREEALENAKNYSSAQAWKDAEWADSVFLGKDVSIPENLTEAEIDAWYEQAWNEANGKNEAAPDWVTEGAAGEGSPGGEALTTSQIDDRLDTKLSDDEALDDFLYETQKRLEESPYDGQADDRDEVDQLRRRINREMHTTILLAAQQVYKERERGGAALSEPTANKYFVKPFYIRVVQKLQFLNKSIIFFPAS